MDYVYTVCHWSESDCELRERMDGLRLTTDVKQLNHTDRTTTESKMIQGRIRMEIDGYYTADELTCSYTSVRLQTHNNWHKQNCTYIVSNVLYVHCICCLTFVACVRMSVCVSVVCASLFYAAIEIFSMNKVDYYISAVMDMGWVNQWFDWVEVG